MGDIVITPASNDVNSTAGTLIVRTSDLRPISLRTNDTNRLYIDPTGKIAVNHTDAAAYASQFAIESSLTRGLTVFNPALTNGNTFFGLGFGSNNTNYDSAYLGFARVGGGSTSNYLSFSLYNQNEILNINGLGNVGIGITNPSSKLYVSAGAVALNGRAMYINADITTNVNVYTHTLNLIDSTNDSNATSFALGSYSHAVLRNRAEPAGGAGGILDIYTRVISGDPTVKMTVTSAGKVGIGTISPYSLLDAQVASASPRYVTISTNDGQGSFNGFGLNFRIADQAHDIAQIRGDYESSAGGGYGGLFFATRYSGVLSNRVAFNDNGRVGIGVSYASTLLSVGGPGSTVAASGITLGADSVANLYRSQASQIKTDAQLVAVGGFYSSNTSNYLETVNIGTAVIIEGGVNEGLFLGDSSRWYIGTTDATYTVNADGDLHFRDATNSITRMIISYANGNVGIGTVFPTGVLTIQSNANQLRLQTASGPGAYFTEISSLYNSTHPFTIGVANNSVSTAEYFGIYADAGGSNNRIALLNGNVGIGTTVPTGLLNATRNANTAQPIAFFKELYGTPPATNILLLERGNNLTAPNQVSSNAGLRIRDHSANYSLSVEDHNSNVNFAISGTRVMVGSRGTSSLLNIGGAGSTTASSGITFGEDAQANLYRLGEDSIKTDGNLYVAGDTLLQGNKYLTNFKSVFIFARGTGSNNSTGRYLSINSTVVYDNTSRGLRLTIINATNLAVVSNTDYDTYGSDAACDDLATAINGMTSQQIGILTSFDAWERDRSTLRAAALNVGLTKLGTYSTAGAIRKPYAAVFNGTSDTANATTKHVIERMESSDADATRALITTYLTTDGTYASIDAALHMPNALYASDADIEYPIVAVNSVGNVGIGTTTAATKLEVYGVLRVTESSSGGILQLSAGASNVDIASTFYGGSRRPITFTVDSERVRIDAAGRVGIGTASALAHFHVTGQTYLTNVVASVARNQLTINTNGANYAHFYDVGVSANNALAIGGNGAIGTVPTKAIMSWRLSTENVGIGLTNPEATSALHIKNLDAAAKVTIESADTSESLINFSAQSSEYSVGFVRDGSNVNSLRFCAADNLSSNEVMRLQNTNVGIGTTNPNYKLDVAGAIAMHDENQDIDSRFYGATFLRGWQSFSNGSEANITYTTDGTSPVGVEVLSVSSFVWARGPKIRLDRTQNYEVELWVRRQTANTAGDFYVVVSNYDNGGNVIAGDGTDWHYPIAVNPLSASWTKYRFIVGPYGGTKDHSPNARYISVGFIANYTTGTDVIYMTGFKCRPIPRYNNDNLTLFNDGRVGIGTTQPTGVLHLYGNTNSWQTSPSIVMASSSTINANVRNWRVGPADTAYGNFHIGVSDVQGGTVDSNTEGQAFTITYDQKVGLGTYIPVSRLHVYNSAGSSTAASNAIALFEQNSNAGIQVAVPDASEAGLFFSRNGAAYYTAITRNGTDLLFKNNSLTRMTINNAGNVGIGIASPSTLLSVGGAGSTVAASGITFGGDAQVNLYRSAEDTLRTDAAFTNGNITLLGGDLLFANDGGGDGFQFDYYQGKMYIGNYGGTAWHMVIQDNGYVGIGTTQPTGKLHIVSSVAGETVFRADGTNGTLLSVVDDLSDSLFSVNNGAGLPVLEVFADDRVVAGQYGSGDFVLTNNKIGIGTTNPINKLSVIGAASIGSTTYNTVAPTNGLIVQGIVGIGLTNPTQKLHVKSSVSQDGVMIDALQYSEVAFRVNGSASKSFLALTSIAGGYVVGSSANSFIIRNDTDIFMTADAGATSNITIKNNGNVGIGLTNPSVRLEVLSTAVTIANLGSNQTSQLVYIGNSSATQYSDLILRADNGQGEIFRAGNGYGSWGGSSALNIYNSNGPIAFHPNSTVSAMFLSSAGYLGIATTVPAEKLDVRGGVVRSNARVTNDQGFPVGHYTPGETVFEIDPTWSQLELQKYFNSASVTWAAVADAPGGYCIYIDGAVNVGGFANSGFPYIPVDTNDIFYMECWIQNVGTNQGHYMGSQDFDQNFSSLGGNPGSYGYWVMSNSTPTTTWTKVSGYISGFSASVVGQFKTGTKYWTPQALFNYTAGTGTRACRISGWKVIKVYQVGDRSFAGNVNVAADLYVADELGVGVAIANKRLNYGAQISVASASIQLVLGRTATSTGQGAIGADANNTFAVWNVSGGATRQFSITQQGDVGVGNINPTSRLTIGTNFASVKGISVSTDDFGTAQFVARKAASKCAYGILAWENQTYLSAGIYYDGSTWIHHNANNNNQLFVHVPGGGIQWYASNDGAGSWNVASAVPLWDDGARWKSSVRATRLEDSYITGGNFALGTDSPTSRLTVLGTALTAATKNTYAVAVGNANNTDLTFGADASYAYIQSWGSKPLYINNQGNNVLVNAYVGIGTITPVGKLDVYDNTDAGHIAFIRNLNSGTSAYSALVLRRDGNNNGLVFFTNSSNRSTDGGAGNSTIRTDNGKLLLGAGASTYHSLETNGNVGIGLTNPAAARLHIKGNTTDPVLRVETALLEAGTTTSSKTFVAWLPIMTGAAVGDKVFIPLFK